jgi:hypothetical protein
MSGISDGVTIGIVLLLLFGALFFYIWLRVQQIEKRALLLENILLDLKLHTESTFGDFPAVPAPAVTSAHMSHDTPSTSMSSASSGIDYLADLMPAVPRSRTPPATPDHEEAEAEAEVDYSSALDEVHEVAVAPSTPPAVVSAMMPAASFVEQVSVTKMGSNYESMTIKELRALAKTRRVQGVSSLSRAQLILQLKDKDSGAAGTAIWGATAIKEEDESSAAGEVDGALDAVAEGAAALDA